MTVRLPPSSPGESSSAWTIDFREMAPAKANTTMFEEDPLSSLFGGLAVGVPGEVRGLEEAHKRWGTLPWKRLVQPSVDLAQGWKVSAEVKQANSGAFVLFFFSRVLTELILLQIDFFTDLCSKTPTGAAFSRQTAFFWRKAMSFDASIFRAPWRRSERMARTRFTRCVAVQAGFYLSI